MGNLRPGKYTFGNKTKAQILSLTSPLTLTGTCSAIAFADTTINGVGTLFTQQLFVGSLINISTDVFKVASIISNTSLTIDFIAENPISAGNTIRLLNPKRIKSGDSVYNLTDRMAMYYSGDSGTWISPFSVVSTWKLGNWCNGQISGVVASYGTANICTEGNVLTSDAIQLKPYTSGTVDTAISVAYFTVVYEDTIISSIDCGIHNVDSAGAIAKGNFCKPSLAINTPAVVLDSTISGSGDSCGIACTSTGTPIVGELEMLVNIQERF